jgi:hypothetical protein
VRDATEERLHALVDLVVTFDDTFIEQLVGKFRQGKPQEVPQPRRRTKRDVVAALHTDLKGLRVEGYSWKGIAQYLVSLGVSMPEATLKSYFFRIARAAPGYVGKRMSARRGRSNTRGRCRSEATASKPAVAPEAPQSEHADGAVTSICSAEGARDPTREAALVEGKSARVASTGTCDSDNERTLGVDPGSSKRVGHDRIGDQPLPSAGAEAPPGGLGRQTPPAIAATAQSPPRRLAEIRAVPLDTVRSSFPVPRRVSKDEL